MRKIQRQSRPLVSAPPTSGPMANERADRGAVGGERLGALLRRVGNALESRASETANMIAAPTPCTARAELSITMSDAAAHTSEVDGEDAKDRW